MNADTLIFRLMHAACTLKGMCGNEPDKRSPEMVREWNKVQAILDEADDWVRSTPDEDQTLPCEDCGEDVPTYDFCGNDRPDGSTEYLCPDCYEPTTGPAGHPQQ